MSFNNLNKIGRSGKRKIELFHLFTKQIRGGVIARPGWWDVVQHVHPNGQSEPCRVLPPTLVLPEDKLLRRLHAKLPVLRYELYNSMRPNATISQRFVNRQWHLMWNQKLSEAKAFDQCRAEFQNELERFGLSLVGKEKPATQINIKHISELRKVAAERQNRFINASDLSRDKSGNEVDNVRSNAIKFKENSVKIKEIQERLNQEAASRLKLKSAVEAAQEPSVVAKAK